MQIPQPSVFNNKLLNSRLQVIADFLLEELYSTEDDLTRSTDSAYSIGCTAFDRMKNRIIQESGLGKYSWLGIKNAGFDLVFTLDGVPCRFSNDDPANPTKKAVLSVNRFQMPFVEFAEKGEPCKFCFIVDRGPLGVEEPKVVFLGFNANGDVICEWSNDGTRFDVVGSKVDLTPKDMPKPKLSPKVKQDIKGNDSDNSDEQVA